MQRYDVERAEYSGSRRDAENPADHDEENWSANRYDSDDMRYRRSGSADRTYYAEGYQRYPGDYQRGPYRREQPRNTYSYGAWHGDYDEAETSWHRGERGYSDPAPYRSPAYASPQRDAQRLARYGYGDEFRRYGRDVLSGEEYSTGPDPQHRRGWHGAAEHERYDSSRFEGRRYETSGPYPQAGAHAAGYYGGDSGPVHGVGDFDELPRSRGGHGHGGASVYDYPRNENQRGRGPKNYARSDERIREDVSEQLADDEAIDAGDIEVAVSGGVVTLSGSVDTRKLKHRAEDIACNCGGVKDVQNQLRLKPRAEAGSDSLLGQGAQEHNPAAAARAATDQGETRRGGQAGKS